MRKKQGGPGALRVPSIFRVGTKVVAPIGRRRDGKWSGILRIIAVFLDPRDARCFLEARLPEDAPAKIQRKPKTSA